MDILYKLCIIQSSHKPIQHLPIITDLLFLLIFYFVGYKPVYFSKENYKLSLHCFCSLSLILFSKVFVSRHFHNSIFVHSICVTIPSFHLKVFTLKLHKFGRYISIVFYLSIYLQSKTHIWYLYHLHSLFKIWSCFSNIIQYNLFILYFLNINSLKIDCSIWNGWGNLLFCSHLYLFLFFMKKEFPEALIVYTWILHLDKFCSIGWSPGLVYVLTAP